MIKICRSTSVLLFSFFCLIACTDSTKFGPSFYESHKLTKNTLTEGSYAFKLQHQGRYAFKISTLEKPPNPINVSNYKFKITYIIKNDDVVVRKSVLTDLSSPWWGGEESGFILEWLNVPDDLPSHSMLKITYSIIADDRFISTFGDKVGVGIWKISDK